MHVLAEFRIKAGHWQEIVEHLTRWLPEEACGLIAGDDNQSEMVVPVENQLHSPVRFRMAAQAQFNAFRTIEKHGYNLLAIFHSHPTGPQEPSTTDLEEFAYPGVLSIICTRSEGCWQARAYLIENEGYREIKLLLME